MWRGAKVAKSTGLFPSIFELIRIKFYSSKWPWEKLSLGSVRISESFVMKSINVEGGFYFVEDGIFQNR